MNQVCASLTIEVLWSSDQFPSLFDPLQPDSRPGGLCSAVAAPSLSVKRLPTSPASLKLFPHAAVMDDQSGRRQPTKCGLLVLPFGMFLWSRERERKERHEGRRGRSGECLKRLDFYFETSYINLLNINLEADAEHISSLLPVFSSLVASLLYLQLSLYTSCVGIRARPADVVFHPSLWERLGFRTSVQN